MQPDEIKKMINDGIAKAVEKMKVPAADPVNPETPASEALTSESVQKMIEESIKKAFEDLPTAKLDEVELEGAEPVSKESIEQMIKAAIEPVLKARGLPSNLNDDGAQEPIEKGEAGVFDNFFV